MIQHVSEADLVVLLKQGNQQAMKELYDRHVRYLTAVASRYVGDEELRDVLQESLVKAFTAIERFQYRGKGSLRAWLARIVVNEAISHLRAGSLTIPINERDPLPLQDEDPPTDDVPIEVIHGLIRSLPAGYRAVFNLYVFEQRSHREIASLLGISENTSASQLHRAKALLSRQIREYKSKNTIYNEQTMER